MHYPQVTRLKTLCLFFVIVLHALYPFASHTPFWSLYADTQAAGADIIIRFFGATLIPAFIFASGFLLEKTLQTQTLTFSDILGIKIKRLLAPWFFTMLFWLVPLYTLFDIPAYGRPAGSSLWEAYARGFPGLFTDHLWFLLALFWATLFWLICRPLADLLARHAPARLPAMLACRLPDLKGLLPTQEKMRNIALPEWISRNIPHVAKPDLSMADLTGLGIALVAALIVQVGSQSLTWYCFNESAGPIIYLYCGMLAYRHRDWLDTLFRENAIKIFFPLAAAYVVLLPAYALFFPAAWLLGILGSLLAYQICLGTVGMNFPLKDSKGLYACFEKNAFRFYLFHMPTTLVLFKLLSAPDILAPWLCIPAVIILTLLITAVFVRCSHWLEETQLPKIAAGMRPNN